jgi:hypothetical protein
MNQWGYFQSFVREMAIGLNVVEDKLEGNFGGECHIGVFGSVCSPGYTNVISSALFKDSPLDLFMVKVPVS